MKNVCQSNPLLCAVKSQFKCALALEVTSRISSMLFSLAKFGKFVSDTRIEFDFRSALLNLKRNLISK
jgi:hypothetical protein